MIRKKIYLSAIMVMGLLFAAGTANAGTILVDVTTFSSTGTDKAEDLISFGGDSVKELEGTFDHVRWAHFYEFNPPAGTILSGKLEIELSDDDTDRYCFIFPIDHEWGFGIDESHQWAIGEVDEQTYSYNVNVNYLADGKFEIYLGSLAGDFSIESSTLTIEYVPVPEPSFIILLGLGLGAAAVFSLKK